MHYWCKIKVSAPSAPSKLLLDLSEYRLRLAALEYEIGWTIDQDALMGQLIDSLRCNATAETDVEYLYLDLVEQHCYGDLYHEFEQVLDFMMHLSKDLLDAFRFNQLYDNGQLLYTYQAMHADGVLMQREDLYHEQLNRELHVLDQAPCS
jgi:hypothetical protein